MNQFKLQPTRPRAECSTPVLDSTAVRVLPLTGEPSLLAHKSVSKQPLLAHAPLATPQRAGHASARLRLDAVVVGLHLLPQVLDVPCRQQTLAWKGKMLLRGAAQVKREMAVA